MSPVARRRGHTGRALVVSTAVVLLLVGVAFGVALLASQGDVEVRLGDDTFPAGEAESMAEQITEGGPVPFSDVAGGSRDIVLQHLGSDHRRGWLALAARPPGTSRECSIQWQADDEVFRLLDPDGEVTGECDGRELPPDGTGLPQYPVEIREGELYVDLNAADRTTTTG
jgi:hypothetical protein